MTEISACPTPGTLRDFLDGGLSDERQAELNGHLENCRACQELLESLAAGKETWTEAARNLHAKPVPPEAGLERVMAESKKEGQSEPEAASAEVPLDFLTPSDDPAHLGRLANYEVTEVINRSGMSIVLKAFDPSLHRMVAVKVLAPQLATTAAARARFRREGFAAAAISHEHVVAVYAVDEINGLPYLVMEYISGESLQQRLDRDGPLELKEILRIGIQTAQGLAAAHAQGLVHRDIKPANILLHNGVARVKITDFGLARAVDDATLTQSGFVAGTPQYMSPEQARGDAIDHRTDLFSLGSVLYAMCTGRPPFRASTTMGVLKRVSDETPRPVREVNAEVPPWLADIIGKLHKKNPAERFQTAAEVAEVLGRQLAQLQQASTLNAPVVVIPAPAPSAPLRRARVFGKRPWAIAAAILPILASLFVVSEATGVTNVTEFVATVLRIRTANGTLVIETDDPGVEVIVDGGEIKIHGAGPKEIRVKPGEHRIRATRDGKQEFESLVTVTRGGREIVRIRREDSGHDMVKLGAPSVYGLPTFTHIATLSSHIFAVSSLVFGLNGKTLLSAGSNRAGEEGKLGPSRVGAIELWDLATHKSLWLQKDPSSIEAAAFSPGSTTLVTGDRDGTVRLRDADKGNLMKILKAGNGPVHAVAFAPDGQTVAAGNADGKVRIVRVGTKEILERFEGDTGQGVARLAYSPDGKILAVAGYDRPRVVPQVQDVDGKITKDDTADMSMIRLFEVGSGKNINGLAGHHGAVTCLAFSPDGKLLATGGADKMVRLWDVAGGKELTFFPGHAAAINVVTFSPDGTLLISAGADKTVKIWELARRKLILSSQKDTPVRAMAISPDGKTLAVGGTFEIKLWNIASVYAHSALRQRLATLRQSLARTEAMYKQGAVSAGTVQEAKLAAIAAELELAEADTGGTLLERISLLQQIVAEWRNTEKRVEQLYKAGAASETKLLEVKAKRQEAEINLERERARVPGAAVPTKHQSGIPTKTSP